jgi:hypothetical protein
MSYFKLLSKNKTQTQTKHKFNDLSYYWTHICVSYSEKEQLIIKSFISYYLNRLAGFDKYNNKQLYQENINLDIRGSLHAIALIGLKMEKDKYLDKIKNQSKQ